MISIDGSHFFVKSATNFIDRKSEIYIYTSINIQRKNPLSRNAIVLIAMRIGKVQRLLSLEATRATTKQRFSCSSWNPDRSSLPLSLPYPLLPSVTYRHGGRRRGKRLHECARASARVGARGRAGTAEEEEEAEGSSSGGRHGGRRGRRDVAAFGAGAGHNSRHVRQPFGSSSTRPGDE